MRKLTSILALILYTITGFSQVINYGISCGLGYNKLLTDNGSISDMNYKIGFQINAVISYSINNRLDLRFEPGFANRGAIINQPRSDFKANMNYVTLPININYKICDKFSIFSGPEYALRLSAKLTTDNGTHSVKSLYNKNYDIGINLGLMYKIGNHYWLELKYNRSFISSVSYWVTKDRYEGSQNNINLRDQGFTVGLIYLIR
jgi:hypothetical protein